MGIMSAGIPEDIVIELANLNEARVFVETGTLHGATTRWATNYFDIVHTIERAETLFNMHRDELLEIKGVTPHLGDSRDKLPGIVEGIKNSKAVFWLDGHWSGGDTAGEQDECPLMQELACLKNRPDDIILIDDARLFLCAPPLPHDSSQWPSIEDIINTVQTDEERRFIQILNDVIYIVPDKDEIKKCLIDYAQQHANDLMIAIKSKQGAFRKFTKEIKGLFKS